MGGTKHWLVIAISGVTCGGKTTLATAIHHILPHSKVVSQDDYFLDVDDPRHVWIPQLKHINFDIITSLNMEKMTADIRNMLNTPCASDYKVSQRSICFKSCLSMIETRELSELRAEIVEILAQKRINVLIVEGFCVLNYKPIVDLCDLCYFVTLDREECLKRRLKRVYEPPDCPGYFEKCAWPSYLDQMEEVRSNVKDIKYLNGAADTPIPILLKDIKERISAF